MAEDKKISGLDNGGVIQKTDQIPVTRAGGNVRVAVGSAGTKVASDEAKDAVASVSGAVTPGHLAIFTDENGTVGDGGEVGGIILNASPLSPVYTNDLIPVIRNGVIYLASLAACLAASAPPGSGGRLNFSTAGNSGLAAGVV